MEIEQKLTKNDIKEGLVRISGENLSFFWGGKVRPKDFEMQITLPDGEHYVSIITFNSSQESPRFLKNIRGPLRAYYRLVDAKCGDTLKIKRNVDDSIEIRYVAF
jgi:hypothetical protein